MLCSVNRETKTAFEEEDHMSFMHADSCLQTLGLFAASRVKSCSPRYQVVACSVVGAVAHELLLLSFASGR